MSRFAGIVLAGGRSSRMGQPKVELEWHGTTLLARVVGLLARGVDGPVVVVCAPGQRLPELAAGIEVTEDSREGRGPLEGISSGLHAIGDRAEAAYVSSTDAPFLRPAFVRLVTGALDSDVDLVVPRAGGRVHPLAAVYRTSLRDPVDVLIAADRMRPAFLFDEARTRYLEEKSLKAVDPELTSLANLNTPEDYEQARALPPPRVRVERFGTLRPADTNGVDVVEAATLGAAASAVGTKLDDHVVAALNGDQISRYPGLPLVEGDVVALMSADAGG